MSKTRTITLSGRPPVTINEGQWPVIASASDEYFDGQVKSQSFRTTAWFVKVRRHEDGRAIVYAGYTYDTAWKGERSYNARTGKLLEAGSNDSDICDAIKDVCEEIASAECHGDDAERWPTLAADCIADMPAEELM